MIDSCQPIFYAKTNVSTQEAAYGQGSRISRPYEHKIRQRRFKTPCNQRAQKAGCSRKRKVDEKEQGRKTRGFPSASFHSPYASKTQPFKKRQGFCFLVCKRSRNIPSGRECEVSSEPSFSI